MDVGAIEIVLPKFVRKELDGYLERGLVCRGFARLRCTGTCNETRLVAFSCKGRGFCPSCLGRKMCARAAHLMDDVMPRAVPLRQWVLTMPFAWRKRVAYDGALWSALTRVFTKGVSRLYGKHSGAVIALQRTSSDMKLNPHIHAVFLDGHYVERQGELDFMIAFALRARVSTSDVATVLEKTRDKMFAYLRRRKRLAVGADDTHEMTPLAASAVAGTSPPAGPEWRRGTLPVTHHAMKRGRPLCVALDGFTLHAATRHRSDG